MAFVRAGREVVFAAALAIGASLSASALAADMPMPAKAAIKPVPAIEAWTFSLTPYVWATSLSGSTTVRGFTSDIDASFFDILEHTQFPKGLFQLAAFGEARYGRFGLLTDIAYMKLGLGASLSKSRDLGRLASVGIGASAGLTVQMVIAEIAAAYEVARLSPATAIDLYAGGRVWWQRAEADFTFSGSVSGLGPLGLGLARAGTAAAEANVSWVDPLVGARLRHSFAPGIDLVVSGDVGGFGAGSKFSWQALAALDYEFKRTKDVSWSGMIGYKALNVDYTKGSGTSQYEYDMTMYGPVFGITARF